MASCLFDVYVIDDINDKMQFLIDLYKKDMQDFNDTFRDCNESVKGIKELCDLLEEHRKIVDKCLNGFIRFICKIIPYIKINLGSKLYEIKTKEKKILSSENSSLKRIFDYECDKYDEEMEMEGFKPFDREDPLFLSIPAARVKMDLVYKTLDCFIKICEVVLKD